MKLWIYVKFEHSSLPEDLRHCIVHVK